MAITEEGLAAMGVDSLGLERLDREILTTIIERFNGGPVGIDTIAASIGEERVTIEDAYEPYLIQAGLLYRTQKGRMVSHLGYEHMGLSHLDPNQAQTEETEDEDEQEQLSFT